MRPSPRLCRAALLVALLATAGCGGSATNKPTGPPATATKTGDQIPPDQLGPIMEANRRGLGLMEQYKYGEAAGSFREVHRLAPGWRPGSTNLAIALLNDTGLKIEKAKEGGGGDLNPKESNFQEALGLLDAVLKDDPDNLHAHFCRGVILHQQGKLAEAHRDFQVVTEADPGDGHAWYWLGTTLTDTDSPPDSPRQAGPEQAEDLVRIYKKALACNPYLDSAVYALAMAYRTVDPKRTGELLKDWKDLKPDREPVPGPGEEFNIVYGEMGKYAQVINPGPPRTPPSGQSPPPRFDTPSPLDVTLPEGHRWAGPDDFTGPAALIGRARARFGAAIAPLDADGDGTLDLFLAAAVVGPKGIRDVLLINRGDGKFADASAAAGLPDDRASLGVAVADFDADRRADLFLTGVGDNRLLRNVGGKFEDVTDKAGLGGSKAVAPTARWLDLDQDGDLDLYIVNYTDAGHAEQAFTDETPSGVANVAFRNDGRPAEVKGRPPSNWAPPATAAKEGGTAGTGLSIAFTPWPDADSLSGGVAAHTGVAALDLDSDRDIDLVLVADGADPVAVINDRLGRFRATTLVGPDARNRFDGLLTTHFDRDDRADLLAIAPDGGVGAWRNVTTQGSTQATYATEVWPTNAKGWRAAVAADLDLDGWPDLLGLPAGPQAATPVWARNEGDRLDARSLGLGSDPTPLAGLALGDLAGDPLPDLLLLKDGSGPQLARNLGNGNHWLALDLNGRWNVKPKMMRTNAEGFGVRLSIEGDSLNVPYTHTTPDAALAQSNRPAVLGMGPSRSAQLLRLRWPDGVMQSELNVQADQLLAVDENNRKEGSCPVLFTWDGERFVCLGDFLGGGGLGYLVEPGVYGQPDRDEAVPIGADQLKAIGGVLRMAVVEPMSEVAYLDQLTLDVVDLPPRLEATPDERFAPGGNRPTGQLLVWEEVIRPRKATDLAGRDLTDALRSVDRHFADGFARLEGWIGYAEQHGIVLDFGDQLSGLKPDDRIVLYMHGSVEYPYSQTNYAAATAGVPLRPPVLERRRDDGTWEVIEADPGYPAGISRMTTLDLTGKLGGPSCVLRLRTNMELYWDQAFLARVGSADRARVATLPVARAELAFRGYLREVSPDGRLPLIYDYDYPDPAPLARLNGLLTRYGDVAPLLRSDDDQLCLVGPGDEVRLEYDAARLPELPTGWTRRYVLRSVGYCKDADPFTAASDTVGPLPWRGMGPYPFEADGERPLDPLYREYLRTYQTRRSGD